MADGLLILHFMGLMLAAAGVLGSVVALASVKPEARQKKGRARRPGRAYAQLAAVGIALLWASGLAMMTMESGVRVPDSMFWMKLVFAVILTLAVAGIETIHARKSKQAGGLLASLGPLAGLSLVAAVIFAVLAYH
ncbi:MAG: hypothetical protein GC155_00005 [Alphaproteobacteria bacterium]|nr:hypothetical protein [Alphaproteobacteria bacterium]